MFFVFLPNTFLTINKRVMVIKAFSDGTQTLNTDRYEQYPIRYSDEEILAVIDHEVSTSVPIPEVGLLKVLKK